MRNFLRGVPAIAIVLSACSQSKVAEVGPVLEAWSQVCTHTTDKRSGAQTVATTYSLAKFSDQDIQLVKDRELARNKALAANQEIIIKEMRFISDLQGWWVDKRKNTYLLYLQGARTVYSGNSERQDTFTFCVVSGDADDFGSIAKSLVISPQLNMQLNVLDSGGGFLAFSTNSTDAVAVQVRTQASNQNLEDAIAAGKYPQEPGHKAIFVSLPDTEQYVGKRPVRYTLTASTTQQGQMRLR